MQDISSFFDKFKNLITTASVQREKVAYIVGETISTVVDPKNVDIQNGIANIKGSSVLRSEIMLKKNIILEKLKNNPSTAAIKEVR